MGKICSGDNRSTEWRLRGALVRAAVRGWRVRVKEITGRPDFFFDGEQVAVFVDGCYWHGCPCCGHIPKRNSEFWTTKLALNKARDREVKRCLEGKGFKVLRLWEHRLLQDLRGCVRDLVALLDLGGNGTKPPNSLGGNRGHGRSVVSSRPVLQDGRRTRESPLSNRDCRSGVGCKTRRYR
jgi:DNA mismatch endonuclease, patch repair protein